MGHKVELTTEYDRFVFGRGQIVQRDPKSGVSLASCSVCTQANRCFLFVLVHSPRIVLCWCVIHSTLSQHQVICAGSDGRADGAAFGW